MITLTLHGLTAQCIGLNRLKHLDKFKNANPYGVHNNTIQHIDTI